MTTISLTLTPTPPPQATSATTATPSPEPLSAADTIGLGSWLSVVLSATVIAALITGSISLWLARTKSQAEERARVRNTFAEAFQAYADYKEMPYAVRRRDSDKPTEERRRLADELRAIQSRLSYYETWISIEAPAVGQKYSEMVQRFADRRRRRDARSLELHRYRQRRRHEHSGDDRRPVLAFAARGGVPVSRSQSPHQPSTAAATAAAARPPGQQGDLTLWLSAATGRRTPEASSHQPQQPQNKSQIG